MTHKTFKYHVNYAEGIGAEHFELVSKPVVKRYRELWDGYYLGLKVLNYAVNTVKKQGRLS